MTKLSQGPEPIALVGIGCRLPGDADDPDSLWHLLCTGRDAVSEIPSDRWDLRRYYDPDPRKPGKTSARFGGFIRQRIEEFDAGFFSMSPREAACLDPQIRLLLETTWEAFEDAGVPIERKAGSDVGVFVGGFMQDSASLQMGLLNRDLIGVYTSVGASLTMLAARLSYTYDFRGPCISIDTACSSSLVAAHYACTALWNGECSLAIVGGVNSIFNPAVYVALSKGGFLSPDGRCKAFDASANGYVRAEGAAVAVLKPLARALADGDRVYALIRASGVNQDGASEGITAPNQDSQETLLREVYRRAGLLPEQVQYVEAHGTGTAIGDRTEAHALGAVLGAGRPPEAPCLIASLKTNVGHLEGAAGIGALIKASLSLYHREIPAHLHFKTPNPAIPFDDLRLRVVRERMPWPSGDPPIAAVNSFGYGGTNAHLVLQGPPPPPPRPRAAETATDLHATPERLVPLSARSPAALRALAGRYADLLASEEATARGFFEDVCYTASCRRSHGEHRLAVTARSTAELAQHLRGFAGGGTSPAVQAGRARGERPRLAFVYTGMGPQWWAMGRELLACEPAFRAAAEETDAIFHTLGASPLAELGRDEADSRMADAFVAQTTNFVLQVGLTALWRSWGIEPEAVVGHSAGEAAAAWAAGALTLADASRLCYHRARLQASAAGTGRVLAIELPLDEATRLVEGRGGLVGIAAVNGPSSVALSGVTSVLEAIARELETREVPARFVFGNVGYHSHLMDPLQDELIAALGDLRSVAPARLFISTVTGRPISAAGELDGPYWWRNVRQPVQLARAVGALVDAGLDFYLQIGPHPVLTAAVTSCLLERGRTDSPAASLVREKPERASLLTSLGRLHVAGYPVDFERQRVPGSRHVRLPTYPWQRERHWLESQASREDRVGSDGHPLLGRRLELPAPAWEAEMNDGFVPWLREHRVHGEVVLPGAAYVEIGLAIGRELLDGDACTLEGLDFHRALVLADDQVNVLHVSCDLEDNRYEVHARAVSEERRWTLHASGRILREPAAPRPARIDLAAVRERCGEEVAPATIYPALDARGLRYGRAFQGLRQLRRGGGEVLGRVELPIESQARPAGYRLHPALLDACFHALLLAAPGGDGDERTTYLPVHIDEVRLRATAGSVVWAYGRMTRRDAKATRSDLWLCDDGGAVLVEVRGVEARAVSSAERAPTGSPADGWFYELRWEPLALEGLPAATGETARGATLLFADRGGVWKTIGPALMAEGQQVVVVTRGPGFARIDDHIFQVDLGRPGDLAELISALGASFPGVRRVLYLAGLDASSSAADAYAATGIDACTELLHVVQPLAQAAWSHAPRLWIVTRGAQRVDRAERRLEPSQAPLWGLGRVIASEQLQLRASLVDLDAEPAAGSLQGLVAEVAADGAETEVAYRDGRRYAQRFARVEADSPSRRERVRSPEVPVALDPAAVARGRLAFVRATRRRPGPGELEIEVRTAGIAYKDALKLKGRLADEDMAHSFTGRHLGADCAGIVAAVGEGVEGFAIGDEVMASAPGAFASFVTTHAAHVWHKPSRLTLEEATTLGPHLTAYFTLEELARLRRGESVLIHSAAGGVGLAAVQWARSVGAEILATAGSPQKREHLRSLGIRHVFDTRSLAFADEVLEATAGRGVDVVLCSVRGEALRRSLGVLAPHGRFVDLVYWGGERLRLGVRDVPDNVTLVAADLEAVFARRKAYAGALMREVIRHLEAGRLQPLPHVVFPAHDIARAFERLAAPDHVGRVLVSLGGEMVPVPPAADAAFPAAATYLITGGLGGFGLEVARWLVEHGARHLALVGRSGASTARAKDAVAEMTRGGARVAVLMADVSREEDVVRVLDEVRRTMPPLRGVFHAAAAFDDKFLANSTAEILRENMAPKALGAWFLHKHTAGAALDHFVLFSSIAGLLGPNGTAAYSASNQFLDALAHYRDCQGLAALSVAWGQVAEVGIGVRDKRVGATLSSLGYLPMPLEQLMATLGALMRTRPVHACVAEVDWRRWAQGNPVSSAPRMSRVVGEAGDQVGIEAGGLLETLLRAAPGARPALVAQRVGDHVAAVLGAARSEVEPERPLGELGLTSVTAAELVVRIQQDLGVVLPVVALMRRVTVHSLTERIGTQLAETPAVPAPTPAVPAAGAAPPAVVTPAALAFPSLDGLGIFGHLSLPPGPGPHPAVVVHTAALGGALDGDGRYAHVHEHGPLVAAGYAVFTVDQRGAPGHGERYARLGTLGGEDVNDLVAAARFLAGRPEIDRRRVAVMGTSRGAYAALLALTRAPDLFRAAVLAMGFYDPVAYVRRERALRGDGSPLRDYTSIGWEDMEQYFSDPKRRPLEHLAGVTAPLLVLHGQADEWVEPAQSLALRDKAQAQGLHVELVLVPGMDHDLDHRHPAWLELWRKVSAFLGAHTGA